MDNKITAGTKLYGLIGNPVSHSFSPYIHNFLFKRCRIDGAYLAFNVEKGMLNNAVQGFKALGGVGLNITAPFKEEAAKYVDELSQEATFLGAVNTIKNVDGKLLGYNTDVYGVISALEGNGISLAGKKAVLLGSGGAAGAICCALKQMSVSELVILNRTVEKAGRLCEKLADYIFCRYGELSNESIMRELRNADIVISALSADANYALELEGIKNKELIFFDINYNRHNNYFLENAKRYGFETMDGLEMLIFQALKAFEIWTGIGAGKYKKEIKKVFTRKNSYDRLK